ncbi:MAG: hypothetical protein LBF22_05380 [Deltaproteobacteria bacterium]|jgi:cell division protein ZapA (FtsZ GTPase activity inhibitor)|nr:hypothetical protein [Deltaproteobacteria bacterium]
MVGPDEKGNASKSQDQGSENLTLEDAQFADPFISAPGRVTVTFFGRQYQIQSDNPARVSHLANIVKTHILQTLSTNLTATSDAAKLDTTIQASFRLALALINAQEETLSLRDSIQELESKLQSLIDKIEQNL